MIVMTKRREKMDSVRASRDGHEYHEAWVARKCLGLLLPKDSLIGVAIEGFSPVDQAGAEQAGNEIADAVLYYGEAASFEDSHQIVVVQVKYSKASEDNPFRAADAKKTLDKFAKTYRSHKKKYGITATRNKLRFELLTNRPILPELHDALAGLVHGTVLFGIPKEQADQVEAACSLKGKDLVEFVRRLHFTGLPGNLQESKHGLAVVLADWSAARDPLARVRLNSIRELARDKANLANQNRNVILRADVLTALELQDEHDLMPCPASFPNVGTVLERNQLADVVAKVPQLSIPLVVHASGGIGKTVFMSSVASRLAEAHEVVLFDCFGMGQYRAPGDARHLPRNGLIHIANELACRGLCDPLLPTTDNSDDLIRVFRLRMGQAAETVRRLGPARQLILLLDAIDNASEQARDRGEPSFPEVLLSSLHHSGPLPGMQVVVSSRTHRRIAATGGASCEHFELQPFSIEETRRFLRDRLEDFNEVKVQVAQSRSRGNARVLEHLVADQSGLLASSEIGNVIQLDELLTKRIDAALRAARRQGYRDPEISAFLAGLASLPPPVPLREFAEATGLSEGAISSFAADLSPLLEHTKHGLMFRDEPTETLIREQHCADKETLHLLASKLLGMQAASIYASTTLPDLLQRLEDGDTLFQLAFDERTPSSIKSAASRQAIRHARLRAAVAYAAERNEVNRLVPLLVELSTLAASDQRGTDYILENPDLAVSSGDADSIRRLFELRTDWPGTRHARLAIAYGLDGDSTDAFHHAHRVKEWTAHWVEHGQDGKGDRAEPTALDMASVPFSHLIRGEWELAAHDLAGWVDWYAFEVMESLFPLLRLAVNMGSLQPRAVQGFLHSQLLGAGALAAAIPFAEDDQTLQQLLIGRLAECCGTAEKVRLGEKRYDSGEQRIIPGLLRAASIALMQGMKAEARKILSAVPVTHPPLHVYTNDYWSEGINSFLGRQALSCVANGEQLAERHVLPQELAELTTDAAAQLHGKELVNALKTELGNQTARTPHSNQNAFTTDTKNTAMRFLDHQLEHWLKIARAFSAGFDHQIEANARLRPLLELWPELLRSNDYYSGGVTAHRHRLIVAERLLTLTFEASPLLGPIEVVKYLEAFEACGCSSIRNLIDVVGVLAIRPGLQALAGKTANKAKLDIEREDEVDRRASLFADLARAIAPASQQEAVVYFHRGLEQMDAVGSGDYQFVNELMLFTASLHGEELSDEDSHTLSNICELNLGEEHKFQWGLYGMAMAKVSGVRGLAKLTRWEDRSRVSLDYTLLPYIKALIETEKMDPVVAMVILRTASPAELWVCGTEQLVDALESRHTDRLQAIAGELITQYQQNNPHSFGAGATRALARLAKSAFGEGDRQYEYLTALAQQIEASTNEFNELNNWRNSLSHSGAVRRSHELSDVESVLTSLLLKTDPVDEDSLADAIEKIKDLSRKVWGGEDGFFVRLRGKVPYGSWSQYIGMIARQDQLKLQEKLRILKGCKDAWTEASNSISNALHDCAAIIIRQCADEFVSFNYLSVSDISELSGVTGVDIHSLVTGLISEFSRTAFEVPASVWLSFATTINALAADGIGQAAVSRLLNTGAAKLAMSVADGAWIPDLYPTRDQAEAAAGLIWFALGSPRAERRWMGAHSLRVAVRLGSTEILDIVAKKFETTDAASFQAKELPFFHLHAKLWLLITLARVAVDEPRTVSKYRVLLEQVALDPEYHHVLFKHFAMQALLACVQSGDLVFEQATLAKLKRVNQSAQSLVQTPRYRGGSFYKGRPEEIAEPHTPLHLDYDFGKYDVSKLGDLFGKEYWQTSDAMNAWVRTHDAEITHMSESKGRTSNRRSRHHGFSSDHHSYGEQLCWHALHAVAGEFLSKHPVLQGPYDDGNPWQEWLRRRVLTRADEHWLADGTDIRPLATRVNLRELYDGKIGITGSPAKIRALLGISTELGEWLVVDGRWRSIDGVDVHIQSGLVTATESPLVAFNLARQDPFQAYIPRLEQYENDHSEADSQRSYLPFRPWIVDPDSEAGLDEADLLGVVQAAMRPRLANEVNTFASITSVAPDGRSWVDPSGAELVRSQLWRQEADRHEGVRSSGAQIQCRSDLVQKYLATNEAHLVMLIVLRQYEPEFGERSSRFRHSTAVLEVTPSLAISYYHGRVNELHGDD